MLRKLTAFLTSFIFLFALIIKDASALPKSPFLGMKDESSASTAHPFLTDVPTARLLKPSAGLPVSLTPAFDVSLNLSSVAMGDAYNGLGELVLLFIGVPILLVFGIGALVLSTTSDDDSDHSLASNAGYILATPLVAAPPVICTLAESSCLVPSVAMLTGLTLAWVGYANDHNTLRNSGNITYIASAMLAIPWIIYSF